MKNENAMGKSPKSVEGLESARTQIRDWPKWKQVALLSAFGLTVAGTASTQPQVVVRSQPPVAEND